MMEFTNFLLSAENIIFSILKAKYLKKSKYVETFEEL